MLRYVMPIKRIRWERVSARSLIYSFFKINVKGLGWILSLD